MAEEPDRLSQLPDELLHHILHLAPCREAATTAVLSRRWHQLRATPTGTVKIDIPTAGDILPFDSDLLRAAEEALAASHAPVERLDINVGEHCNYYVHVVGDVLSLPASRDVQDVRIRAETSEGLQTAASSDNDDTWLSMPQTGVGEFFFSYVSVPSAALRVLHLTNCNDDRMTPTHDATFPCLEVLRLRRCKVKPARLRDMVAASPQLAALQLEYVCFTTRGFYYDYSRQWDLPELFCCPGITTLVLLNCFCEDNVTIQLYAPRVQHFKYRGKLNKFTLRSPLRDVRRAYLHILTSNHRDVEMCEHFWTFLKNFSNTKVLKLKLDWPIHYVAALDRWRNRDLLIGKNQSGQSIKFCVEHLEIDAQHNPDSKDTGMAIANLLQCCPALHDLKIKLNTADQPRIMRNGSTCLPSKALLEFQKSVDRFRCRKDCPVVPLYRDDGKIEVSDIPGLSDRWFHIRCLPFHLKRLSLQFHMDKNKPNCIGVQLIKFFIERGMALEVMYIDDGHMKLWEHLNCKISGYPDNPQPFSEYHFLARMSQALSMNHFSSSSKVAGWFYHHKVEVRRTNPLSTSRSFTILPLADT